MKSITQEGRDVLNSGVDLTAGGQSVNVDVVLSANGGSIEGSVGDGTGAIIIMVPADPRLRAQFTAGDPQGHFSFQGVPPGRYKMFAWEEVDVDAALYDPDFRKPFEAQAATVDVAEKQNATVQLDLIRAGGK